jgi:hypothetical protein
MQFFTILAYAKLIASIILLALSVFGVQYLAGKVKGRKRKIVLWIIGLLITLLSVLLLFRIASISPR